MDDFPEFPSSDQAESSAARAHLHWRHSEDPLVVEATEIAGGWRHLTVTRPATEDDEHSPALGRLFAEFTRYRGRPHAVCGGHQGDRRLIVIALGPPDAGEEIIRLYRLAEDLNPGDWELSFLGRPISCRLPP
jgi:hypothetical protein